MKTNNLLRDLPKGFVVRARLEIYLLMLIGILNILMNIFNNDPFHVITLFLMLCAVFYCLGRVNFITKNKELPHSKESQETSLLIKNRIYLLTMFLPLVKHKALGSFEMNTLRDLFGVIVHYIILSACVVIAIINIIYAVKASSSEEKKKYVPYLILDIVWFALLLFNNVYLLCMM